MRYGNAREPVGRKVYCGAITRDKEPSPKSPRFLTRYKTYAPALNGMSVKQALSLQSHFAHFT
jgi:hypothetical protein